MTTIAEMQADEARRRASARSDILEEIKAELERAYAKHGTAPWGRHEAYAIALEELDEVWDEIRADGPPASLRRELVQLAAVCIRYLEQPGDRYATIEP